MIPLTMVVAGDGRVAETIQDKDPVPAINVDTGLLEYMTVRRFGTPVDHMTYRLRTLSGCEAVLSNAALVWPERGGYVNVQAAAERGERIRCIVNGDAVWEPIVDAGPADMRSVISLVVPNGLLAVGHDAALRIFTTGNLNAAPSSAR